MNYEKRYKEALERAKEFYNNEGCRVTWCGFDAHTLLEDND